METSLGYKAAAAAKSSAKGKQEDKVGRQGGDKATAANQERTWETMKWDKLGRQGGSGSQEQDRREIMKGNKLGIQGAKSSQKGKS